jgi:mannose-6-phosphate isomerase-like protein (cupin superfamily)
MVKLLNNPTIIEAAGNKPKIIEEFFGKVNSNSDEVSIAKMKSPQGWIEPGQCPEFDEYTIVIKGCLRAETKEETFDVKEGQAILTTKNEWIRYSSPYEDGAEYIAVCIPAFSPDTVNRDDI